MTHKVEELIIKLFFCLKRENKLEQKRQREKKPKLLSSFMIEGFRAHCLRSAISIIPYSFNTQQFLPTGHKWEKVWSESGKCNKVCHKFDVFWKIEYNEVKEK